MNGFNSMRRDFLRYGGVGWRPPRPCPLLVVEETARIRAGIYDVRKYGATGDGKTSDTDAVNHAIEAASAAGGGVVVFPPGTYLCFSIHLKSHVHLHLQQGSAILAADSPLPGEQTGYSGGTYDAAEPNTPWEAYQDYGHNHWHNSLLWGENIEDFSITGPALSGARAFPTGAAAKETVRLSLPSRQAWATRPSRSRTATTSCCATSRFSRPAISACCYRRRQPHHRQSQNRHRPRRHRYRLLPECTRLQLHGELAVG